MVRKTLVKIADPFLDLALQRNVCLVRDGPNSNKWVPSLTGNYKRPNLALRFCVNNGTAHISFTLCLMMMGSIGGVAWSNKQVRLESVVRHDYSDGSVWTWEDMSFDGSLDEALDVFNELCEATNGFSNT
jgi:hypothetical protein